MRSADFEPRHSADYGGGGGQLLMDQQQVLLHTELLDNLQPDPHREKTYQTFSGFMDAQVNAIEHGDTPNGVRDINLYGNFTQSASGKSEALAQWTAELVRRLTGQVDPRFEKKQLEMQGERVVVWNASWVEAIKAAKRLGLIPKDIPFGMWEQAHLNTITAVMQRGIQVAREGVNGFEGIAGNAVGLIPMDAPVVSAAFITENVPGGEQKQQKLIGFNRLLSALREYAEDPEMGKKIFAAFLYAKAKDIMLRLEGREELSKVKSPDDLRKWFEAHKLQVDWDDFDQLFQYLPGSSAPVEAATEMAGQMDDLSLELDKAGEVPLSAAQRTLLRYERDLISQGYKLTDKKMKRLQGIKLRTQLRTLFPKIVKDTHIAREQTYQGWNNQRNDTVHAYPALRINRNLFEHIAAVNPELLRPKTEAKVIFSLRKKEQANGREQTVY